MPLDRLRWAKKSQGPANQTLAEAAKSIHDIAHLERLALLYTAERDCAGRGHYWFATNMINIIVAVGRSPSSDLPEDLTAEKIKGLRLDHGMLVLRAAESEQPSFVDLKVPRAQFKKYLDWVRTTR